MAMRLIVALAKVSQATQLIDVESAHIDGCLYHGQAGLDFIEKLVRLGAKVTIPTTLNVSSLDLLHPGLVRLDRTESAAARRLMDAYVAIGGRPTWTCAPYQLAGRPETGADIAWAESNAIVFANSVLEAVVGMARRKLTRGSIYDWFRETAALSEAIAALRADEVVRGALGASLADEFDRLKRIEWTDYARHVSAWELERYGAMF